MAIPSGHVPPDPDLPPSLQRALVEPADYALRLRTGEVVRFTRAERQGAFVILHAPSGPASDPRLAESIADFPHGLEVRISDIVWSARGPTQALLAEAPTVGPAAEPPETPKRTASGVRVPVRIKRDDQ